MRVSCLAIAFGLCCTACDTSRFTAQQSLGLLTRGSAAVQEHWDVDLVGHGMPANILQLEGLYGTLPEDSRVGMELIKAYVSYGYGWIEDEAEEAEARGDLETQEALLLRARYMYLRARNVGLHHLRLIDDDIDRALASGTDGLVAYLHDRYDSADDAALLLWTGYAWGKAIDVGRDDPELVLDLGKARAFVERSVELDPSYFYCGGLTFIAAIESSLDGSVGGDPSHGRQLFEQALQSTQHEFFQIQVQFARTYAVTTGDRDLYVRLLREVIDSGDPRADVRLANRLARRRAVRMLHRVDEIF